MSWHREQYVEFFNRPVVKAVIVTAVVTGIIAALFWNAVL